MPCHAAYSNDDSKLEFALEDAFGGLHIEEPVSPYDDIAGVIQELQRRGESHHLPLTTTAQSSEVLRII